MNPVRNQSLGARFEKIVAESFERCGLFYMQKVTPPSRIFGKRVIFTENPFLDFIGTVKRTGRMIVVECKATTGPRLRLSKGGLSPQQIKALYDWHNANALPYVLWLRVNHGVKVIHGGAIWRIAKERRHLRHAEDGAWVPVDGAHLDFGRVL